MSDSVTPWTVTYQAPPSMGFSRQEYWSVLAFPSPGNLPDPRIEPGSPALQADALTSEPNRSIGPACLKSQSVTCWFYSFVPQLVKNPLAMREAWVRSLGWEDPLEKREATHPHVLA